MTPNPRPLTDEVESALWAFEAAWSADSRPPLERFLPAPDSPHFRSILRELACVDLERATAAGIPISPDDYLARYPALAADPLAVDALRRQQRKRDATELPPTDVPRGGWQEQAAALFADFQALGASGKGDLFDSFSATEASARLVELPELAAGDTFLGFRIVRPLGRGAFGRVYLAHQSELANRPVAIKLGAELFDESQTLAQLQHTNIVPILSAHRHGRVQLLCMPYLGATTLADVVAAVKAGPGTANAVWSTLAARLSSTVGDRPVATAPESADPLHRPPAALLALGAMPHTRAVVWVGMQLASGLAHAHARGVLHRDIKPANVLIADDGTPLLLDFNLASRGRAVSGAVGGTLPYMAPEQLSALLAGSGQVDERSDVYSLGVLLVELLTGRHPFPIHNRPLKERVPRMIADRQTTPSADLTAFRAAPALGAILARCLAPQPEDRYPTAEALAEDLHRQFEDRPLKHTREPSRRERARKFIRRNPRFLPAAAAVTLALAAVALGGGYWVQSARAAHAEAASGFAAFVDEAGEAELLLSLGDPTDATDGERLCRTALGRYGVLAGNGWHRGTAFTRLPEASREVVRGRVPELLLLLSRAIRLQAMHGAAETRAARLTEALGFTDRAAAEGGEEFRRPALFQRALLLFQSGKQVEADAALAEGQALPVGASRPWLDLSESYRARSFDDLENTLAGLLRDDPGGAVLWALRGVVALERGKAAEASACFSTVHALRPTFRRALVWRAQAEIERGEPARAAADLDAVLTTEPNYVPALVYRGIARHALKQHDGAEADLTRALEQGATQTRIYFIRARVRAAQGNRAGADADHAEGLRRVPSDELSWIARGVARQTTDPNGAVTDFAEALKLNPHSREAAQNTAATLSEFLKKPVEAVLVFDDLLLRYPSFVDARIGRAVLLARHNRREEAHADAEAALKLDRAAGTLYRAGCVYALTSAKHPDDRATAFRLLSAALLSGFGAEYVAGDDDLKPLHADKAEFARLRQLAEQIGRK